MRWPSAIPLILGALVFLVNPSLGCSAAEDEFVYGESEMAQAILGEWRGTFQLGADEQSVTLILEQGGIGSSTQELTRPRLELQCGTREFIRAASACSSMSVMPLVGTLTSDANAFNGAVHGQLLAGLNLDSAHLSLTLADGSGLEASLKGDRMQEGHLRHPTLGLGSFTLRRP